MGEGKPTYEELEGLVEELRLENERLRADADKKRAVMLRKEAYFSSLMDVTEDIVMVVDEMTAVRYLCPAIEKHFGYDPEEPIGKSSLDYVHPEDHASALQSFMMAMAKPGEPIKADIRMKRKDGVYVPMAGIGKCAVDDEGKKFVVVTGRDITERLEIERQLRESEMLLKNIVANVNVGLYMANMHGKFVTVNAVVARIAGYDSAEEFIATPSPNLYANQEDRARFLEMLLEHGSVRDEEFLSRRKDGSTYWVSLNAVLLRDKNGEPEFILGAVEDITKRKDAEEALRKSEERYRAMLDSSPDAISISDLGGTLLECSEATARMLGYESRHELLGTSFMEHIAADEHDKARAGVARTLAAGFAANAEYVFVRKDGARVPVEISASVVRDSAGNPTALLAIIKDITARKLAEREKELLQQQLLHAQKMEAIGQLAGGIAHDFNNILGVIIGTAEIAMLKMPPGDPAHGRMQRIFTVAARARDLTMKLLTFARKEKLDMRAAAADALIGELTDMLKRSIPGNIRIRTVCGGPRLPLLVDFNQMLQALLNICNNACDAMPDGGELTICTSEVELEDGGSPAGLAAGKYCVVEISDTGHGFDPEVAGKFFEPFFTTKGQGKGTGLGLSITLGIIQGHRGHIEITGAPEAGATVRIYLPVSADGVFEPQEEVSLGVENNVRGTVLIVDDNPDFLATLAESVQSCGFKTEVAHSGAEAVEIYRELKESIDLVVLDMIMPDMDGNALFVELKRLNPDVKAVLCSGYSIDEQARKIRNEGIEGYLQKPFTSDDLLRVLTQALGGQGSFQ